MHLRIFYPDDGEYPDVDEVVTAFWEDDSEWNARVVIDDAGELLWLRQDGVDWVLSEAPTMWVRNVNRDSHD